MAEAAGLASFYVPHGIDTNIFRPIDRNEARKRLGWPADKFIVGMVSANKGNPPRKSFFEQITAFAALHKLHPDTMLYLHTDDGKHGGECVDLVKYCEVMGLKVGYLTSAGVDPDVEVLFAEQYTYLMGMPDVYLVDVYNSFDVLMNVSMGEGFGIPIVEAQACGCPVIVGDWTSMSELCFGGWKIPKTEARQVWHNFFEAWQWSASPEAITERLITAYDFRDNQDYRNRARKGALQYDADKVTEKYWKPVLESMAEMVK
jgi:glycosyltransferase involved in cell wall biosynthesis